MDENKIELKPCPFCGGTPELRKDRNICAYVRCNVCDARSAIIYKNIAFSALDEAIKSWNRRANNE